MTRITIITTLQHNVGDDFVREGIIHLLEQTVGKFELKHVHKHLPITARPEFAWFHSSGLGHRVDKLGANLSLRATRRIDAILPVLPKTDRIRTADILVQSGGPVYWVGSDGDGDCASTEWWQPLIERRWIPYAAGRPFLNLAGGTCQPYNSDASEFASRPKVLDHIRRFYDLTALTTVRDKLSLKVLRQAGREGVQLPCTSIFAVNRLGIDPKPGEFVVLNYMPAGGHFVLGQKLDGALWERRFVSLAKKLARNHRVIIVCHDGKETNAAIRLLPDFEIFSSPDYQAYLRLYSKARWGILNRVHGAFALASLGKPAAVIGSDSRARMVAELGLPEIFVNQATDEWLENTAQQLESQVDVFPSQMAALKESVLTAYCGHVKRALNRPVAA